MAPTPPFSRVVVPAVRLLFYTSSPFGRYGRVDRRWLSLKIAVWTRLWRRRVSRGFWTFWKGDSAYPPNWMLLIPVVVSDNRTDAPFERYGDLTLGLTDVGCQGPSWGCLLLGFLCVPRCWGREWSTGMVRHSLIRTLCELSYWRMDIGCPCPSSLGRSSVNMLKQAASKSRYLGSWVSSTSATRARAPNSGLYVRRWSHGLCPVCLM